MFIHAPYLKTLPSEDKLRTPLYFSSDELELLSGTNMYGATLDRKHDWQAEWEGCRVSIAAHNEGWATCFTW